MSLKKEYDDIPGTFVFDADRSREGYQLNQFCISLRLQKNRDVFNADEAAYLDKYAPALVGSDELRKLFLLNGLEGPRSSSRK
jgi:protocatechuate 4,5-dioxygenase alpha subunit